MPSELLRNEPRRPGAALRRSCLALPLLLFGVTAGIHLAAPPDHPGESLTRAHKAGAAGANLLGPWGVLAVRAVGFPNRDQAGYRVFEPVPAVLLTLALCFVIGTLIRTRRAILRTLCVAAYVPLILLWFGTGLLWISAGRR